MSWHKKTRRWQAAIWHNSKNHSLGYFVTEEAAAEAVQTAAKSGRFSTRCVLLLIIVCRLSGLDLSCVCCVRLRPSGMPKVGKARSEESIMQGVLHRKHRHRLR